MSEAVEDGGGGGAPCVQAPEDDKFPVEVEESPHHDYETEHLLGVLPEEIWMKVLKELTAPNDLESACNAVSFFRDILLPRRKEFLFQKVWPLLATHMEYDQYLMRCGRFEEDLRKVLRYSGEMEMIPPGDDPLYRDLDETDEEGENDNAAIPLAVPPPWRWYHEIFSFRLVCKSWCNGIDHFYQHHPRHFQMGEDPKCDVVLTSCWTDYEQRQKYNLRLTGNYRPQRFMEHFDPTHSPAAGNGRNPFISRKASVLLDLENFQHLRNFMAKYGQHIWYLDLHVKTAKTLTARAILTQLQELFPFLGNLMVLKILAEDHELSTEEPPIIHLPALGNLQFLSLRCLHTSLSRPVIIGNPHVSMLELTLHYGDYEDVCTTPLPNLKKFSASMGLDFEIFRNPQPVPWMLEKVHLDFGCLGGGCEWEGALGMIENKWAESLTDVQLRMPTKSDSRVTAVSDDLLEKCHSLRLNLPKVTRFRVALTSFCSLDFILPMKDTLEYLDVDVCFEHRSSKKALEMERGQVIQFLGYTNRPLESNVWTVFTKLKRFRIFDQDFSVEPAWSFTRKDWKLKMRKEKREIETV